MFLLNCCLKFQFSALFFGTNLITTCVILIKHPAMKATVDTKARTVEFLEDATVQEVLAFMDKLAENEEEWTIKVVPAYPVVIGSGQMILNPFYPHGLIGNLDTKVEVTCENPESLNSNCCDN